MKIDERRTMNEPTMNDFYFVQPGRTRAKREKLNKKLTEAGKPPMK
jgi:hypothetical protein